MSLKSNALAISPNSPGTLLYALIKKNKKIGRPSRNDLPTQTTETIIFSAGDL